MAFNNAMQAIQEARKNYLKDNPLIFTELESGQIIGVSILEKGCDFIIKNKSNNHINNILSLNDSEAVAWLNV